MEKPCFQEMSVMAALRRGQLAVLMHLLSHLAVPVPWYMEVRWNATGGVTVV